MTPAARNPTAVPRFSPGDAVCVRSGTMDPDCPEFVLGNWSGTIHNVRDDKPARYLVRWNEKTLKLLHAHYRRRREQDGLAVEEIWLTENDLELDESSTLP